MDQLAALDEELHSSVSELMRQAQEANAIGAPAPEDTGMAGAEVQKRCQDLLSCLHERGLLDEGEAGTDAGGAGKLCLGEVVALVGGIVTRLLQERDEAVRVASAFEAEAVKLSASNRGLLAASSSRGTEQCPETTAAGKEEGGAAAAEERARRTQENLERQLAAVRVYCLFLRVYLCEKERGPCACGCGWAQGHVCASMRPCLSLGSGQVC